MNTIGLNFHRTVMEKSGCYPLGVSDCDVIGISGNCNFNCPVLQEGECGSFCPEVYSDEELNELYDGEMYVEEIDKFRNLG